MGDGAAAKERKEWQDRCFHVPRPPFETVSLSAYYNILIYYTPSPLVRYGPGLPAHLPSTLIQHLRPYISTSDIPLLAHAVAIIALLLRLAPSTTFPLVEREFLKDVTVISCSPLASGVALESLLSFYGSLVEADIQIASHVIPNLVSVVERPPKSEVSYSNVAKCVAEVVKNQQGIAAGTISEFTRYLKVGSGFYFLRYSNPSRSPQNPRPRIQPSASWFWGSWVDSCKSSITGMLFAILRANSDMSPQHEVFNIAIEYFSDDQEEIRTAAAFAAGMPNEAVSCLRVILNVGQ